MAIQWEREKTILSSEPLWLLFFEGESEAILPVIGF